MLANIQREARCKKVSVRRHLPLSLMLAEEKAAENTDLALEGRKTITACSSRGTSGRRTTILQQRIRSLRPNRNSDRVSLVPIHMYTCLTDYVLERKQVWLQPRQIWSPTTKYNRRQISIEAVSYAHNKHLPTERERERLADRVITTPTLNRWGFVGFRKREAAAV